MNRTPEFTPAHAECKRGCTDCCKTARHITLVKSGEAFDDLKSVGIRDQLANCGHLEGESSPHHDKVVELMSWAEQQGVQTERNLLTGLGLPKDKADRILEDNEETDEAI